MPSARSRSLFLPALLVSVLMLAAAFYLEWSAELVPCLLCYSQRLLLGGFVLACLCAVVQAPGALGARIYALFALLFSTVGALLAARHVWLQSTPSLPGSGCQPPVRYLMESMPLSQLLKAMVVGSPDCVPINWSFFDLTVPEWSLLSFLVLAAFSLHRLFGRRRATFSHPGNS